MITLLVTDKSPDSRFGTKFIGEFDLSGEFILFMGNFG